MSGVNVDGIEAEYTDGVLKLTMPKKVETVPPTRRLEIKQDTTIPLSQQISHKQKHRPFWAVFLRL